MGVRDSCILLISRFVSLVHISTSMKTFLYYFMIFLYLLLHILSCEFRKPLSIISWSLGTLFNKYFILCIEILIFRIQTSAVWSFLAGCWGIAALSTSVVVLGTTSCTGRCSQSTCRLRSVTEITQSSSTWRELAVEHSNPILQSLVC